MNVSGSSSSPAVPSQAHTSSKAQGKKPETPAQAQARIEAENRAQRRTNDVELQELSQDPAAVAARAGNPLNRPDVPGAEIDPRQLEEGAVTNRDAQDTGTTPQSGTNAAQVAKTAAAVTVVTGAVGGIAYGTAKQIMDHLNR